MTDTKENILLTALRLFAANGYEAVSVSQIAGALGMVKSALYKHYKSKRDIFDHILERMSQMDYERASEYEVPEGSLGEMAEKYEQTPFAKIEEFTEAQFVYWTEKEFSSLFRRMLTLEQYRSEEMAQLYQQYLCSGPLEYMADLFGSMTDKKEDAMQTALEFYAPMFMMYSVYDGAPEVKKPETKLMLREHIRRFASRNPEIANIAFN